MLSKKDLILFCNKTDGSEPDISPSIESEHEAKPDTLKL
jgi:hypothetical protein